MPLDVASALAEHGLCAQIVVDRDAVVRHATPFTRRLLGRDVVGEDLPALAIPGEGGVLSAYLQALQAAPVLSATSYLRCAVAHGDGRTLWLQVQGVNALGVPPLDGLVLTLFDISHHVEREHELQQLSTRDLLTGLPNRFHFEREISQWIAAATIGVAAIIDIDQFKMVNDRHGHGGGDLMLRTLADRLVAEAPPGAVVARLGGDEFGLLLPGQAGPEMWQRVDGWRRRVSDPIVVDGAEMTVGLSIGMAALGEGPVGNVLRECDLAMYAAKVRGRGRVVEFGIDAEALVVGERLVAERLTELEASNRQLHRQARTDALTRLANALALAELAGSTVGQPSSEWARCSVLFVDIDHFGAYNHRYGDAAGDDALRTVAQCLARASREGDLVFRKGGEEFVAVLPHTDLTVGMGVGERLRAAVQALAIEHLDSPTASVATVSVAVASVPAGGSVADGIRRAGDVAMAQKLSGLRNRVQADVAGPAAGHDATT